MSLRAVVVLAVFLAAAVAALFWLDRSPVPPPTAGVGLGTLLDAPHEDATVVEIGGCRLEKRGDDGWSLVKPYEAEADSREVESFLAGLAEAKLVKAVGERGCDRSGFGLDEGATVVRVERARGKPERVIRLGRHSPVGPERYVELGDGRVFLADLGGVLAERPADSFREKRLIPAKPGEIRRIAVERPAGRLVLVREGNTWSLTEPVKDLADFAAADALARGVASLSFARFLTDEESKGGEAAARRVEIAVGLESVGSSAKAELSAPDDRRERLARRDGSGWTGRVADKDVSELIRPAEEFREHRPVLFSSPDLRGVRIEGSGIRLRAFRDREGSGWSVSDGEGPPMRADGAKIDEFVDRLRWIRARRVVDAPPSAFPEVLRVEFEGEGAVLGRLEVDRLPPAAPRKEAEAAPEETARARSTFRPGCVFDVPLSQLAGLPRRAADLALDPKAADAEPKP